MAAVTLELPWPPSVNHYWRYVGSKVLISHEGRQYRKSVEVAVYVACLGGRKAFEDEVEVVIQAFPPDRRKRDLDNTLKATLDSVANAGLLVDDSQIGKIVITREEVCPGGKLLLTIRERQKEAA